MTTSRMNRLRSFLVLGGIFLLGIAPAAAHCDALDGPVVTEARAALESGDVTPVLKWVTAGHEAEVRAAFADALEVRAQGETARRLADTYFFETLVRVHRAGEGAPFTGLKPAGQDPGPAVTATDRALETGSEEELVARITERVAAGIHERFHRAVERRARAGSSVEAGRAYVAAYVDLVHYVERIHEDASGGGSHDHPEM